MPDRAEDTATLAVVLTDFETPRGFYRGSFPVELKSTRAAAKEYRARRETNAWKVEESPGAITSD
jgi:hypothetical protein